MIKRRIASHNIGTTNLENLIRDSVNQISPELWQAECNHVNKVREEYMSRDQLSEIEEETIIIRVGESDSDTLDSDFD